MRIDRFRIAFSVLFVLTLGVLAVPAAGQAPAPAPVNVSLKGFPITVAAGDYELVIQILDFPAGSGVPQHSHGGPVVGTVITGELTLRDAASVRVVEAGESWTERPGDVHMVVNESTGITRVVASFLIPRGAAQTTLVK